MYFSNYTKSIFLAIGTLLFLSSSIAQIQIIRTFFRMEPNIFWGVEIWIVIKMRN